MNHLTIFEVCGTVFEELCTLLEINGFLFSLCSSQQCVFWSQQNGQLQSNIQNFLALVQVSAI